jgi:hypothetical protein
MLCCTHALPIYSYYTHARLYSCSTYLPATILMLCCTHALPICSCYTDALLYSCSTYLQLLYSCSAVLMLYLQLLFTVAGFFWIPMLKSYSKGGYSMATYDKYLKDANQCFFGHLGEVPFYTHHTLPFYSHHTLCTVLTIHCTHHTLYSPYTVHCTRHTLYTVLTIHCTHHTLYTVLTIHCTPYTTHHPPSTTHHPPSTIHPTHYTPSTIPAGGRDCAQCRRRSGATGARQRFAPSPASHLPPLPPLTSHLSHASPPTSLLLCLP